MFNKGGGPEGGGVDTGGAPVTTPPLAHAFKDNIKMKIAIKFVDFIFKNMRRHPSDLQKYLVKKIQKTSILLCRSDVKDLLRKFLSQHSHQTSSHPRFKKWNFLGPPPNYIKKESQPKMK